MLYKNIPWNTLGGPTSAVQEHPLEHFGWWSTLGGATSAVQEHPLEHFGWFY